MATLFVRHQVDGFDTWKAACDTFDAERQFVVVTSPGVYQADDDPNDVTVYHHFNSMDEAKLFANSARLKTVMREGGVVGVPNILLANRV